MVDAAVPAKADMLAAARKKLKDFEARQKLEGRSSPASSIISSEPGGGAALNGRSSVVSEDSTALQIPQSSSSAQSLTTRNGTNASPFLPNGNEWFQAYTQLKTQHDELCAHYAQLHSAYSQINADGVHVDAESQIVQLQNALSAMVEEKVSFQSDIRQYNQENDMLRHRLASAESSLEQFKNSAPSDSHNNSDEFRKLTEIIAQKDNLLTALHQELDGARREVASVQASLLNVQHERSEAQARVKSLVKETAAQEGRIEQLKKDIQMKDLYLKQLGVSGSINGPHHGNTSYESVLNELEQVKSEKVRILAEAATMKAHYADREHALQQKQAEMASEIEKLHAQCFASNDQLQNLEHQLQLTQSELQRAQQSDTMSQFQDEAPKITEEDVARRIKEACYVERGKWERKLEDDQRRREEEILEKDKVIFEREQSMAELEMKYRLLEERTLESSASGADLLSLSEQLQNEKATVSRAVAQNKELKERLLETEDRFVALTEEKAAVELAKQAAEHQVRELTKQLNLEAAGLVGNLSEVIASQPHLDAAPESQQNYDSSQVDNQKSLEMENINMELKETLETLQRENSEIRLNLDQKSLELQQVRAELRRSTTHNEQMDEIMRQNAEDENQNSIHVELTQAVGRVQELATENEQMREALNEVRLQLEEERASRRAEMDQRELEKGQEAIELNEVTMPKEVEQQPSRELHEDLWARKELEKRFARAMMQNAELVETIDRLEHINQQLELENDTIADHVVLYQHQRKLVRERLRVKDEQLKAMEEERSRTVARCQELQNVLMTVLNKGGILKEYTTTSLARKAARRVSRSYSHSTVDEMSGDEDVVIDAKLEEVPEREQIHGQGENVKMNETCPSPTVPDSLDGRTEHDSSVNEDKSTPSTSEQHPDASVRRILEIISDISRPQPIPSGQLHCTQCIGELQEL